MSRSLASDGKVDVKTAILTTFDYEEGILEPLSKVPTTLFEDKIKSDPTYALREYPFFC